VIDNTFSRFRSKTVRYKIELDEFIEGPAPDNAMVVEKLA